MANTPARSAPRSMTSRGKFVGADNHLCVGLRSGWRRRRRIYFHCRRRAVMKAQAISPKHENASRCESQQQDHRKQRSPSTMRGDDLFRSTTTSSGPTSAISAITVLRRLLPTNSCRVCFVPSLSQRRAHEPDVSRLFVHPPDGVRYLLALPHQCASWRCWPCCAREAVHRAWPE